MRQWQIMDLPGFDQNKHVERSVHDDNGFLKGYVFTAEGIEFAKQAYIAKYKDWENDVPWTPRYDQSKFIIAVDGDKRRHAMERTNARPSLFLTYPEAICGHKEKDYQWTYLPHTRDSMISQQGVIECEHCLGVLFFHFLGE